MNRETARMLLDEAEVNFRVESGEIKRMARPSQSQQDEMGEMNEAGQHPDDLASETVEREIAFGLLADADAVLAEIEAARQRVSDGTFGRCETCGRNIDPARLVAIPWARRCAIDETRAEDKGVGREPDEVAWSSGGVATRPSVTDSTWDPEDDHPARSSEELALHELTDT